MNLNFKNHTGEIKDIDLKGRRVEMHLASFDNVDYDNDVIIKGAFTKSITERKNDIFFLNQHNWAQPHGKFDVLKEDSYGLYAVTNKLTDTSYTMDALKLYDAGVIKEHSIGFTVMKDEVLKTGVRKIKEVKLYEGSNVTLGANPLTPFHGYKSMNKKEVDAELKTYLKAFRNGSFTDETFSLLEIATRQLMKLSADLAVEEYKSLQADNSHLEPINEAQIINDFIKEKWN